MRSVIRRCFVLSACFCIVFLVGCPPSLGGWTRTFGGTDSDLAASVWQTSDGGYVLAGFTRSSGAGEHDVFLVKTNALGTSEWQQTFGGAHDDLAYAVQQTTDGGYIVAGVTSSFGVGMEDVYLVKTDAAGAEVWTRTFGGEQADGALAVRQTLDGGYIVAGTTASLSNGPNDIYLIRLDGDGGPVWGKALDVQGDSDCAYAVQQTLDGGFIVAGMAERVPDGPEPGLSDMGLIKTDASGNVEWKKMFGGDDWDIARAVEQTSDGGYIVAGVTKSFGAGEVDGYVVRTDGAGTELWSRTYGGAANDWFFSAQETSDGGIILAGATRELPDVGITDLYLVRTDADGVIQWWRSHGGSDNDVAYSVRQTTDGGYILGGSTRSYGAGEYDMYLVKTDSTGGVITPIPVE